jgi:hypothetical protein
MKKTLLLLASSFLAACSTGPEVIPDNTSDSVIMMKLKHEITNGDKITQNWGWILWYLPVLILVVAWAWKELISKKECPEEKKEEPKADAPAPQEPQQPAP